MLDEIEGGKIKDKMAGERRYSGIWRRRWRRRWRNRWRKIVNEMVDKMAKIGEGPCHALTHPLLRRSRGVCRLLEMIKEMADKIGMRLG